MLFDDGGIDLHAADDVDVQVQNAVHGQEGLRDAETAVGRVVQRPLKPLGGGGEGRVLHVADHIAGQGGDTLGAHGISFIGHGGGADLLCLKGLVHFLQMAHQPDVAGKFGSALGDSAEHLKHGKVRLAGVGLAADLLALVHAHLGGDLLLQQLHLCLVPVKELQKAGAGAGGTLAAQKPQVFQLEVQLLDIEKQVVEPEAGPLADGGGLGGLEMGVGQAGQSLVLLRKVTESGHGVYQELPHQQQAVPHLQNVGVVTHIAGGGAQVDDGLGLGADLAEGEHMGHHVVPDLVLMRRGGGIVDVVNVLAHLLNLLVADGDAQLLLRLRQRDP